MNTYDPSPLSAERRGAGGEAIKLLERIHTSPSLPDLLEVLSWQDQDRLNELYAFADSVRKRYMGDGIILRGIIEFSNYCNNPCHYCGLNKNNKKLGRYRMTDTEIIENTKKILAAGVHTIVLQAGEDDDTSAAWLASVIEQIKALGDIAITLSVGERNREDYLLWKKAGADRYLLKIETTNKGLYDRFHPGMSFEKRINCLYTLKELGYQTGSGIIIGLKGQTSEILAEDIRFFKKMNFDMIGIGPFIPHNETELRTEARGDVTMTLKVLALTRIVTWNAHLPGTTSLGSLDRDYRIDALRAGANIIMPNFTPVKYKKLYEIYPGRRCTDEAGTECMSCLKSMAGSIDRYIEESRGDTLKR